MWYYHQLTGALFLDGELVNVGYSGHDIGLNNPFYQQVHDVGPIPVGQYVILPPIDHPRVGRYALGLKPANGTNTFGRSGFFIHGDSKTHNASHGCIIQSPRDVRVKIWTTGGHLLTVEQ